MSDTNWIRNEIPEFGLKIIAEIDTKNGARYHICQVSQSGYLETMDEIYIGWKRTDITRWCPLDVALEAIGG